MIKPKSRIVPKLQKSNSPKFSIVNQKVIPLMGITHHNIPQIVDFRKEKILPLPTVQKISRHYKYTNNFYKFIKRIDRYLDSLQYFLTRMKKLYELSIIQKKIILHSEKSDQLLRTYRAKREVKKLKEEKEKKSRPSINLGEDKDLIGLLALSLGLIGRKSEPSASGGDVAYEPVSGQLIPKGKTNADMISGYPISSPFGPRTDPVTGQRNKHHGGIDVGVDIGTLFALKVPSQVAYAGWQDPLNKKKGYGLLVDVYVPTLGKMFRFGHLSSTAVRPGELVPAGKVLGKSGDTGKSTGPHFHIEVHTVKSYGDAINKRDYGTEPPGNLMNYVVLGDTVKNADGGIETRNIMVGEADPEFIIPMSQMPMFIQGIIEEKIKSLNPYYDTTKASANIIKTSFGSADKKYSAGAIIKATNIIEYHEALSSFTPGDNDYIKKGFTSVGKSKTKWSYVKSNPRKNMIFPYQNTGDVPTIGWGTTYYFDTNSKPVTMSDPPISLYRADALLKSYVNKNILPEYSREFKYWNKFSDSQKASIMSLGYNLGKYWVYGTNFYRLLQDGKIAAAAKEIPNDIPDRRAEERRLLLTGPQIILGPKTVGEGRVGSGIPFIPPFLYNLFNKPTTKKTTSLNNIDPAEQMEVARSYRNNFDFADTTNEIIAFYKPTVYYPES